VGDHVGILGVVLLSLLLSLYKVEWGGGGVAEPDPKGNLSLDTNLFSSLVQIFVGLVKFLNNLGGGGDCV
jgi:hypothetical protein